MKEGGKEELMRDFFDFRELIIELSAFSRENSCLRGVDTGEIADLKEVCFMGKFITLLLKRRNLLLFLFLLCLY
jgi:hypothetical protein